MIILVGMTASGKTSIGDELTKYGHKPIVTTTTRPKRKGEKDGVTYNFVSEDDFFHMIDNDEFIEYTSYIVESGETWYYGTPRSDLIENSVIILNQDGVDIVKGMSHLKPYIVYLNVDEDVLLQRFRKRKLKESEFIRRIQADADKLNKIKNNADLIVNNNGDASITEISGYINYEYLKWRKKQ